MTEMQDAAAREACNGMAARYDDIPRSSVHSKYMSKSATDRLR